MTKRIGISLAVSFVCLHYCYLLWSLDSRSTLERHNQELAENLGLIENKLKPIEEQANEAKKLTKKLISLTTSSGGYFENNTQFPLSLSTLKEMEAQKIRSRLLVRDAELLTNEIRKQTSTLGELVEHFQYEEEFRELLPNIRPLNGSLSSPFGPRVDPYAGELVMHSGVDIAAPEGTEIVAPAFGRIVFSGNDSSFGNLLVIDHGLGYQTQYGHLREILVDVGNIVERGQLIARVGNTGKSTGPHLHYEVRKFGVPVDPKQYMLEQPLSLPG